MDKSNLDNILDDCMSMNSGTEYKEIVPVNKSIIGSNVWFVSHCPECDEKNTIFDKRSTPNNLKYECEYCGCKYRGKVQTYRTVVAKNQSQRKYLNPKQKQQLCREQENCCFWCHREFTTYIFDSKSYRVRQLNPVFDHIKAFSFSFDNNISNFVASCPVCNGFKSSGVYQSENDCRQILEYKWNKALDKGRYEILCR